MNRSALPMDQAVRLPGSQLEPLHVEIGPGAIHARLSGNVLTVTRYFPSLRELVGVIGTLHYGLQLVLALDFIDAPIVSSTVVRIGGAE